MNDHSRRSSFGEGPNRTMIMDSVRSLGTLKERIETKEFKEEKVDGR